MKLMTKAIEKKLPKLYATENIPHEEKIAIVKFFNPTGMGTWYGIEYDPESREFYGYVELYFPEFGYFSLTELESLKLPYGLKIERDLYFKPTKVGEIMKERI